MKLVMSKNESINYNLPVKFWIDYNALERSAIEQIINLSNLPFAFHHVAIMPDCHTGYGMPIGGVLATKNVIIPNAVGVDIGCGMCAVKTSLKAKQLERETLKKIMGKIREAIPVGFNRHKEQQDASLMPGNWGGTKIIEQEYTSALNQIGTLGGGNHFIEIQKEKVLCPKCHGDSIVMNSSCVEPLICPECNGERYVDDNIWIMVHSGSRNLGFKVANYYNKIAGDLNEKWFSKIPKEWQLAFLPLEMPEAKNYMLEMQYCVDFALANRKLMLTRIMVIFSDIFHAYLSFYPHINIAHNYARLENHFGENVIVHRKGATSARKDEMGIIPGSQGSKSYIVRGLDNRESFMSCSHGAGRKMGRKEAQRSLNLEEEQKKLEDQGIIHGIRSANNLDEAAGAYKDIGEVIRNQEDLVEIVTELQPLAVIKGD